MNNKETNEQEITGYGSPSGVHKSSSVAGHVIQTVGHICRLRCQFYGSLYQGVIGFQHKYSLMNFCFSYVCACVLSYNV